MLMDWLPEGEQGGYWQAGLDTAKATQGVTINVAGGGPSINSIPQVAAGSYDYGLAYSDEILRARAHNVPVVALYTPYRTDPRCLMAQPAAGLHSLADISGHPVSVAPDDPYWPYLQLKYHVHNISQQNYTGSLAQFKGNPRLIQQCFVTDEPYVARQQHIPFTLLSVAASGYNPYPELLFTTEARLRSNPAQVAAVVKAAETGWTEYMKGPSPAFARIVHVNPNMTQGQLAFTYGAMRTLVQPSGVSCLDPNRWTTIAQQLEQLKLLPTGTNVSAAFTNRFDPNPCP